MYEGSEMLDVIMYVCVRDGERRFVFEQEVIYGECTPPPTENQILAKRITVLGDGSFCLPNLDSTMSWCCSNAL